VNHFQDWWEYNLDTKEWRSYPVEFPSGGIGQHCVEVFHNRAFFFGGYSSTTQASSNIMWQYTLGQIGLSKEA